MYNQFTNQSVQQKTKKRKHKIIGTVIKVGGRTVGQVIGDTFVKDITNRHMLTTPPAIANDLQALHDAERAGALYCAFTNTDNGIVYRVAISKIWDMGKQINFGYGLQIMLTLSNWTQTRDPEFITSQTDAQEYTEPSGANDVMPLYYKSNAPTGVTVNGIKQLGLFGDGDE